MKKEFKTLSEKKYCQCKHRTINSHWIVCLEGNKAGCDKCGKSIHHSRIRKFLK